MKPMFFMPLAFFLSSCAALYTGEDLKHVPPESVKKINKTVTFRYIEVGRYPGMTNKDSLTFSKVRNENNRYFKYFKKVDPFQDMKVVEFPYTSVGIDSKKEMEKLLSNTNPDVETEYFVDIHIIRPQYPHGAGLGMYGGLLSVASLGIIPAWWVDDQTINVFIFKNGEEISKIEKREDYNIFLSSIFNLVSGSEYAGISQTKLTRVEKNALRNVIVEVQSEINNRR